MTNAKNQYLSNLQQKRQEKFFNPYGSFVFYDYSKNTEYNLAYMNTFLSSQHNAYGHKSISQISKILKGKQKLYQNATKSAINESQQNTNYNQKNGFNQKSGIQNLYMHGNQNYQYNEGNFSQNLSNYKKQINQSFLQNIKQLSPASAQLYSQIQIKGFIVSQRLKRQKQSLKLQKQKKLSLSLDSFIFKSKFKSDLNEYHEKGVLLNTRTTQKENLVTRCQNISSFQIIKKTYPNLIDQTLMTYPTNPQQVNIHQAQREGYSFLAESNQQLQNVAKLETCFKTLQIKNNSQDFGILNSKLVSKELKSRIADSSNLNLVNLQKQKQIDQLIMKVLFETCYNKFYTIQNSYSTSRQVKRMMKLEISYAIRIILKQYFQEPISQNLQSIKSRFLHGQNPSKDKNKKCSLFAIVLKVLTDILPSNQSLIEAHQSRHIFPQPELNFNDQNYFFLKNICQLVQKYKKQTAYSYHSIYMMANRRIVQKFNINNNAVQQQFKITQQFQNQLIWCQILMIYISGRAFQKQFQQIMQETGQIQLLQFLLSKNQLNYNQTQNQIQNQIQKLTGLLINSFSLSRVNFEQKINKKLYDQCDFYALFINTICSEAINPSLVIQKSARCLYIQNLLFHDEKLIVGLSKMINKFRFNRFADVNNTSFVLMKQQIKDNIQKSMLAYMHSITTGIQNNQIEEQFASSLKQIAFCFGFDQLFDVLGLRSQCSTNNSSSQYLTSIQKSVIYCLLLVYPELLIFSSLRVDGIAAYLHQQIKHTIVMTHEKAQLLKNFQQVFTFAPFYFLPFRKQNSYNSAQSQVSTPQQLMFAQQLSSNWLMCQHLINKKWNNYFIMFVFIGIQNPLNFIKLIGKLSITKHENYEFFINEFIQLKLGVQNYKTKYRSVSSVEQKGKSTIKLNKSISRLMSNESPTIERRLECIQRKYEYFQIFTCGLNFINLYLIDLSLKILKGKIYQKTQFYLQTYKRVIELAQQNIKRDSFFQKEELNQNQPHFQQIKCLQENLVQKIKHSIVKNIALAKFTFNYLTMEKGLRFLDINLTISAFNWIINTVTKAKLTFFNYLKDIAQTIYDIQKVEINNLNKKALSCFQSQKVYNFYGSILWTSLNSISESQKHLNSMSRKSMSIHRTSQIDYLSSTFAFSEGLIQCLQRRGGIDKKKLSNVLNVLSELRINQKYR